MDIPQNLFLDAISPFQGGKPSPSGQPLIRLENLPIQTLVFRDITRSQNIAQINVSDILSRTGVTQQRPILVREETVGIEINLNLFGNIPNQPQPGDQISSAIVGQTIVRHIPRTYAEARSSLHLILPGKARKTNRDDKTFNLIELKQIAKNLGLSPAGKKPEVANRLITEITQLYNI